MTEQERQQKYSNLCVLIGDNFMKAKHHDAQFRALVTEADKLLKEPIEEEKKEDEKKS